MKKFIEKIKKHPTLFVVLLFWVSVATAAGIQQKFPTDLIIFGISSSSDDKVIQIDTGDGASNPAITIDMTDKDFDFNKALNIVANDMSLGDGTNTDKTWEFKVGLGAANPKFKYDSATTALSFANDGVNFKKLGSGSGSGGGGVNALAENNPDFETASPPEQWSASGGTFIAETTAPLFGEQSGSWDASALSQTLDSVLAPITAGFVDGTCQAEIKYSYPAGSNADYKMVVRQYDDSGATEITVAELDLDVTTQGSQKAQLFFDCPDDVADDLRIRLEAGVADPGIILLDDVFIGTGKNSFNISQTTLVAHAHYPQTGSGCEWSLTSAGFADFPALAACPAIVVDHSTQDVDITDNDLPDIDFDNLLPGTYLVEARFAGYGATAGAVFGYTISDGSTIGGRCSGGQDPSNTGETRQLTCSHVFTYTGGGARNFKLQGFASSGAVRVNNNQASGLGDLTWTITKYPTSSAEAITLETSGEYWDVNIGGANIDLGTGAVSVSTGPNNANLDMVIRSGSNLAQIPCTGANVASGLTCSAGNEMVGISHDISTAGMYEYCFSFQHQPIISTATRITDIWRLQQFNNDVTIVEQEGVVRMNTGMSQGGSGASFTPDEGSQLCDTFYYSDAGNKTVLLTYRQTVSGSPGGNLINADRAGSTFDDRDINIKVRKITQQIPTPVFTDLQNSLNSKTETPGGASILFTSVFVFNMNTTIAFAQEYGDWVDSVTDTGVGQASLNYSGVFAAAPNCTCTTREGVVSGSSCMIISTDTTTVTLRIRDLAGTLADDQVYVQCHGPK